MTHIFELKSTLIHQKVRCMHACVVGGGGGGARRRGKTMFHECNNPPPSPPLAAADGPETYYGPPLSLTSYSPCGPYLNDVRKFF